MNPTQITVDLDRCFKSSLNLGYTTYHDICRGVTHNVPWGTVDWIISALISVTVAGVLIMAVSLVHDLVTDR